MADSFLDERNATPLTELQQGLHLAKWDTKSLATLQKPNELCLEVIGINGI